MVESNDLYLDYVLPSLKAENAKQVLQVLARQTAQLDAASEDVIQRALSENEKHATSGIGGGVAIPQAYIENLEKPAGIFARLDRLVDFHALDDAPVDLVFCLLSPAEDGPLHLRRLATVSRLFRDKTLCQRLRGADSADAIRALLMPTLQASRAA